MRLILRERAPSAKSAGPWRPDTLSTKPLALSRWSRVRRQGYDVLAAAWCRPRSGCHARPRNTTEQAIKPGTSGDQWNCVAQP